MRGGTRVFLGAEEAALSYARTPERRAAASTAAPPAPPPMTAEEALRQAEAEGLTLVKSPDKTGYKNVSFQPGFQVGLAKRSYCARIPATSSRPRRRRGASRGRPSRNRTLL